MVEAVCTMNCYNFQRMLLNELLANVYEGLWKKQTEDKYIKNGLPFIL